MMWPRVGIAGLVLLAASGLLLDAAGVRAETSPEEDAPEERERTAESEATDDDETSPVEALPSFQEVMNKVDDLYRAESSHARIRMTVRKPRHTRKLQMELWTRGDNYALVVIRKPAREAGTATLRTPDGLWNYAPRADRLIRIPDGLLSDSWMGSHFTNDDLMRETRYDKDYEGEVSTEELDGETLLKVTLTPRPDAPVVYSKLVFLLKRDSWIPVRTDYYDSGEVVRRMTYSDVEKMGGRRIPTVMTLAPVDDDEEMTKVEYLEADYGVDVDKKMFSRRGLRRVAR